MPNDTYTLHEIIVQPVLLNPDGEIVAADPRRFATKEKLLAWVADLDDSLAKLGADAPAA